MSGTTNGPRLAARRLAVRLALAGVFVGLAALAFLAGKGHTILVDNKDAEDGSVQAFDGVMVTIDRQEPLEMYLGDRLAATVMGQRHTVTIEDFNEGTVIERTIRLPLGEGMLLLSVPMLAAGREPALVVFVAPQAVVEVRDVQPQPQFGREPAQQVEQAERVRPARHADDDRRAGAKQAISLRVDPHARQEIVHGSDHIMRRMKAQSRCGT